MAQGAVPTRTGGAGSRTQACLASDDAAHCATDPGARRPVAGFDLLEAELADAISAKSLVQVVCSDPGWQ